MITTPERVTLALYLSAPHTTQEIAAFLKASEFTARYRIKDLRKRGYNLIVTHAPLSPAHYQIAERQKEQE